MQTYTALLQGFIKGEPHDSPTLHVISAYSVRDALDRAQQRLRGFVHAGYYDTARVTAVIPGEPLYLDDSQRVDRAQA